MGSATMPQAPVAVVIAVGLYLFSRLVHGVITFPSLPNEADSLRKVRQWAWMLVKAQPYVVTHSPHA